MQLWERGQIELDTDVREYLPEGFLTKLKYDMPITMLNLMNHNAGWEDVVFNMTAEDASSVLDLEDALKATEPHQVYEPNAAVSYSNWVESKLLESEGYTSELSPIGGGLFYINLYPAGSAAGTLDDFVTFAKALIPNSDGSTKLFTKAQTLNEMLSPTLTYLGTDIDFINHGFWSQEYNIQTLGHGGNTLMYSSNLIFDPISGVGIVIMTNQVNETVYNSGLPTMVFGEMGQMAIEEERRDPSEFAGLYYSARTIREGIGKIYTLSGLRMFSSVGDGNLQGSFFGMSKITAKQIAPNTFIESQKLGEIEIDYITRLGDNAGTKVMSSPYGDALKADADVWACAIIAILFIIAVIWSTIILISSCIKYLIYKIKKKTSPKYSFKKYEIILCLAIILLLVNTLLVGNLMSSMKGTIELVRLHVIISIVLGLIPLIYALLFYKKYNKLRITNKQRISYFITLCAGFIMTFTVIILEMYKM